MLAPLRPARRDRSSSRSGVVSVHFWNPAWGGFVSRACYYIVPGLERKREKVKKGYRAYVNVSCPEHLSLDYFRDHVELGLMDGRRVGGDACPGCHGVVGQEGGGRDGGREDVE